MLIHHDNFILFVPIHIADGQALDFEIKTLALLIVQSLRPYPSNSLLPLDKRMSGSGGAASGGAATENFKSDVLSKISNLHHYIVNAFMLGVKPERGLLL